MQVSPPMSPTVTSFGALAHVIAASGAVSPRRHQVPVVRGAAIGSGAGGVEPAEIEEPFASRRHPEILVPCGVGIGRVVLETEDCARVDSGGAFAECPQIAADKVI